MLRLKLIHVSKRARSTDVDTNVKPYKYKQGSHKVPYFLHAWCRALQGPSMGSQHKTGVQGWQCMGHITWWSSLGLSSWYPIILVKSLQLLLRSGTCRFHLLVPNLEISVMTKWQGTRLVVPVTTTRVTSRFLWYPNMDSKQRDQLQSAMY